MRKKNKIKKVFEIRECTCVNCGHLNWVDHSRSTQLWRWNNFSCWKCRAVLSWGGKVKYIKPNLIRFMDINERHILPLK